jgi:hypothetical protein
MNINVNKLPDFQEFRSNSINEQYMIDKDDVINLLNKFDKDKIDKFLYNLTYIDGKIPVQNVVDRFINMGVDQFTIGKYMLNLLPTKKEDIINVSFINHNGELYMVNSVGVDDNSIITKLDEMPEHIYIGNDGDFYSAFPNIKIYNTKDNPDIIKNLDGI